MASGFDRDKYKSTFEKRFGTGSYDAGLSQAREIGTSRARADFEKAAYNQRVKAFEAEMKEQKRAREKDAEKKKKAKEGNSVIDELVKQKKKEIEEEPKKNIIDSLFSNKKNDSNKKDDGNFLSDMWNVSKRAVKAANPFDDISFGDAMLKNAMEFDKEKSKQFDEVSRSAGRLTNSASLGVMGNIDKKTRNGETPSYLTKRKVGEGGGADLLSDGLGYLIPGVGIAKALKGTKAGTKGVGDLLSKPLTKSSAKTIAKETAKEGAAVGAIMSGTEIAGREAFNPNDSNWKQNLAQFGLETGAGAILDPALTLGASKLLGKLGKGSLGKNIDDVGNVKDSDLPFTMDEIKTPSMSQSAATTSRPRFDIDTLMKSYKGQDVGSVPLKKFDSNLLAKQADDMPIKSTDSVIDKPLKEQDFTKDIDVLNLKDISGYKGATNDVYRIFDNVFGKDSKVSKRVLGELDASKSRYVDMQENLLKELDEKIVKGLGITKGSKLSAYVQDYGEKKMDLPTLMAKAPKDWEKVVKADEWFRAKYDELIDEVNASRKLVYPNSPDKQIPKRNDYYRHFTEFTGLTGLKNIFDTPGAIDPHLAGTSEFTKPRTKWAGFMQQRGMGPYKKDAVGGFLNYVPSASYAKEIDPNIMNFRGLKDEIADQTTETKNLNNFVEFLHDYSNDLAGKTNPVLDRFVQKYIPGGRQSMAALSWVNNRVKTNTILGNLGSTLAQLANVPLGVAFAKQHTAKGLGRTLKGILDNSEPIHKSAFMKERYSQSLYRKFDQRLIDQPQKMAEWLIENSDRAGSSFVWNSVYEKGLKLGVQNPIKYADDNTRRLIAGRGVGEVPLAQKSKIVQMIMPFTLEVGNLWRVMNDMGKAKDFGGLAILFASNFVLNKAMEDIRGNPVTFDPIDAMIDATEPGLTPLQRGGRVAGEALSNLPAGQFLAGLYPQYGEVAGFKGPSREDLFGERNPQRFGTGLVAANGISDPLFKLLPPFGGNQLKKTLEGMEVMNDEGSYKEGKGILSGLPFMGETNELKFPVENSTKDKIQMSLFGPYATDNAREYFDNERRPLSGKQTGEYKDAKSQGVGQEFYDYLMTTRRDNTVKRKIKEISEDETLTEQERMKAIEEVLKQLEPK